MSAIAGGGEAQKCSSALAVVVLLSFGVALLTGCESNEGVDVADVPYEDGVEVGREYTYVLTTHCGIEWARIDGAWWQTAPLNDGNGNPPPGWDDQMERGTLRIESFGMAAFDGGPGAPIQFERTDIVDVNDSSLPDSVLFCF